MTSKKIRLFLVDDPLPALFMTTWFNQIKNDDNHNIHNVGVYICLEIPKGFSINVEKKEALHFSASQNALNIPRVQWCVCRSPRPFSGRLESKTLRGLLDERRARKLEIKKVKQVLFENNIDPNSVFEVWSRDALLDRHFFHLCKNASVVFFEHGVSDIRNQLTYDHAYSSNEGLLGKLPTFIKTPLRKIKSVLAELIEKNFLYFNADRVPNHLKVSLVANEIIKGNPKNAQLKQLSPLSLLNTIQSIQLAHLPSLTIDENCALILLMPAYPKPWGKEYRSHLLALMKAFEQFLIDTYDNTFQSTNVSTLIFKSKLYYDDYSDEGVADFSKLREKYKIVYLSDLSEKNFPTEFYINLIKPKMLVSAFSASSFYCKKIFPDMKIFTYDTWFMEYAKKHAANHFIEFEINRRLFFNTYKTIFSSLLPEEVSSSKHPHALQANLPDIEQRPLLH